MPHTCKCKRKEGEGRARLTCGRFARKPKPIQPSLLAPSLPSRNGYSMSWEFGQIWNQSLLDRPEREPKKRDTVWASEIGGAMIDRYLKMNGVKPSNPPNARSLRKFQAADIWEWVVGFVLKRAGVLIESQEKLRYQYPDMLEVVGKLDHLAGGQPDWEKANAEVKLIGFPPIIENASIAIIKQLSERFGSEPLKTIILEVKSLGSFVFDRYEILKQADPRHIGQQFHYLKAKPLDEGHITYICRDDCRIVEFGVFNPSDAEKPYKRDIEEISHYILSEERPSNEPEVLFDNLTFKFRSNWAVEYSQYLSALYGYAEPIHFRDKWKSQVASWNRVFKRCVTGQNMTKLNVAAIASAMVYFPKWDGMVEKAMAATAIHPEILKNDDETEETGTV